MSNFVRPLGKRVVVEREAADQVTKGGIVIPDNCQERSKIARVITIGTGVDLPISEGQRVLYSAYAGTEIKVGDRELLVLDAGDLICSLE